MNIWILTIGTSDVQLDSDKTNQAKGRTEKQRSDKVWSYWYSDDLKAQHHDITFQPKPLFKDETYRVAPRILGMVYKASSESIQQEIWDYLTFPLLDNFVKNLKDKNTKDPENYPLPEAIAVLLTNQSAIFDDCQRRKPKSPYWQDTCELKPILRHYFQDKDRFPGTPCKFMVLKPKTQEQSLDNWNAVLDLVRDKFRVLKIADRPLELSQEETVYISHQAGTPAISSAVQFCSLAKFGDRVKFLVSNEYNPAFPEKLIEGSSYLRGIRIQEAKALLKRYDYSGVKRILAIKNSDALTESQKSLKTLLDAAIEWNFSNFSKFYQILNKFDISYPQLQSWQLGYEAAYLAMTRLKQGNTVDFIFHSFRSVEGALRCWIEENHSQKLSSDGKTIYLPREVQISSTRFTKDVKAYGVGLYHAFLVLENIDADQYPDFQIFGKHIIQNRNSMFHGLKSASGIKPVLKFWELDPKVAGPRELETRICSCLNLITDRSFQSLRAASYMSKVHDDIHNLLDNY